MDGGTDLADPRKSDHELVGGKAKNPLCYTETPRRPRNLATDKGRQEATHFVPQKHPEDPDASRDRG